MSTVSSGTRRRRGRTSTRRRRKRNRRTSSCWYRYHTAAPTSASRERTRSPPTGHFLSSCAETRETWNFFPILPLPPQELSFEVSLIIIVSCRTYQISFGGDRHQDKIVAHTHLLTLGSLLGGGVHGPPTCLTFENKTLRRNSEERIVTRYFTRASRPVKSLPAFTCNFISILLKVIIAFEK